MFPFLQTNITVQTRPSGGWSREMEGSATHIYTMGAAHVPPPGLRIGPALKQASALVPEGGTHTTDGKERRYAVTSM